MRLIIALLALFNASIALAQNSPCYWSGQLVKCFPTTGIYLDTQRAVRYGDSTTNYVEVKSPSSVTTYSVTWPTAQGASSTFLQNNGSGALSWTAVTAPAIGGTITGGHTNDNLFVGAGPVFAQDDNYTWIPASGLGIGTTTPAWPVDIRKAVSAAAGAGNGVSLTSTITATADSDALVGILVNPTFANGGHATVTHAGLAVNSGFVGIGTIAPTRQLDIEAGVLDIRDGYAAALIRNSSDQYGPQIRLRNEATGGREYIMSSGQTADFGGAGTFSFADNNAGLARFVIDSTGKIGIGTVTPSALLSVASGSKFQVDSNGNIVKINNVTTSFPASQGAASTFLQNDGSGNLSWAAGSAFTNPMTTTGDIIYSSDNSGTPARLAIGGANTVLHGGTTPGYSAVVTGDFSGQLAAANGGTGVNSTATFPTSGVVVTEAAAETLTNKTISGASNTLTVRAASDITGQLPTANGGTAQNSTATFPTSGVVVTEAGTETLTNKTLKDTTTIVGNATDVSKAFIWDLSGATTGKTMTLISSQTNNRSLTLPDATDTLVGKATVDTLTQKSLTSGSVFFTKTGDTTTKVAFNMVSQVPGTTLTLTTGNVTVNQNLSFPDATDTLVGQATTDILTNKDISSATNTYRAIAQTTSGVDSSARARLGSNTNDDAAAGNIGEEIRQTRAAGGSAASLTSAQWADLTSSPVALTAGDWDISLFACLTSSTCANTDFEAGIGTTTGNSSAGLVQGDNYGLFGAITPTAATDYCVSVPAWRVSLSTTTNYYGKALSVFTGTCKIYGRISARRAR